MVFHALRQVYASSAERDETFRDYLEKIGHLYFGLTPVERAGMGGLFGNLLQQFVNGSDSDEENGNTNVSQSSNRSSSSGSPSGRFTVPSRFVDRTSDNRSAPRPREATQPSNEQQQFDLD